MTSPRFYVNRRGSPILPLTISGTPVTTGVQGSPYAGFAVTASGGQPPYSFSNPPAGPLPPGLGVNSSTGDVGGLPTAVGVTSGIILRVTDSLGRTADLSPPFSITITAAGGDFTVTGSSYGETAYAAFKPLVFDRLVLRNLQVPTNAEAIVLHEALCHAFSGPVVSWAVSGPAAANFTPGPTNGTIVVAPGVRATLAPGDYPLVITPTNSAGAGQPATLTVRIVANSQAYFVSYSRPDDSGDGRTPATAWKFIPGSGDYTGTPKTFVAGDVVFMKAEWHRTYHTQGDSNLSELAHHGSAGAPMFVEMDGWGGRAVLSGDVLLSGWTAVTSAEVAGNPNWANIKKIDMTANGGAAEFFQWFFDDDTMLYPANYPTPASLDQFETVDFVNTGGAERYGMINIPCSTTATPRRMYTDGTPNPYNAGTTVTIVDPIFASKFGNIPVAQLPQFNLWIGGNHITRISAASYNFATSTVTFAYGGALTQNNATGMTAYSITFWKGDITQAGQFALSPDGTTAYAWLPNGGVTSISRRRHAARWGQGGYVTYNGGQYQRYSGGTNRAGSDISGGHAFFFNTSAGITRSELHIDGAWIRQMHTEDRDGVIHGSGGVTNIIASTNIYRTLIWQCPSCSGRRFGVQVNGPTANPTVAQLRAQATGRFRGNYVKTNGIGGTVDFFQGTNGIHYVENVVRGLVTMHGNGLSNYDSSVLCQYMLVELNLFENCVRGYTTNCNGPNRNITITGNFFLNVQPPDQLYTFSPWNGEPGGTITRNLMMAYDSVNTYDLAANFASNGATVSNNVIAGCAAFSAWTGSFLNNLVTMNRTLPTSTGGGVASGNTVLTAPNEIKYWNGTFTSAMQAALGPGRIGPFHTI